MKKLGFGMMRLPLLDVNDQTAIDFEQVNKMVDYYLEKGFIYFDTAYMYHNYTSELAVKKCLVERHPRDSYLLADKLPTFYLKEEADNERIFNEQLNKCGVEYFDYYLLHCLNTGNVEICNKCNSFEFARKLKEDGRVKNIGFSFHDTADVLDSILSSHKFFDFVQLQINYLDWENPDIQSRLCYEVAVKHGVDIIVMEPVKGGKLANVPVPAAELMKGYNPNSSIASWAVRYAASLDNVIMVLSGMSNLSQLEDNISYMIDFKPITKGEQEVINKATLVINAADLIACTSCKYCVEGCPMNIAIPDYFTLFNTVKEKGKIKAYASAKADFDSLANEYGLPSACISCRQCETACPQHLRIVEHLGNVSKMFEDKK
jgi:predicted aldo/keto reductase-like oxidoreductase